MFGKSAPKVTARKRYVMYPTSAYKVDSDKGGSTVRPTAVPPYFRPVRLLLSPYLHSE